MRRIKIIIISLIFTFSISPTIYADNDNRLFENLEKYSNMAIAKGEILEASNTWISICKSMAEYEKNYTGSYECLKKGRDKFNDKMFDYLADIGKADILSLEDKNGDALEIYKKIIAGDADNYTRVKALIGTAEIYIKSAKYNDALEQCNHALEFAGNNYDLLVKIFNIMGKIYYGMNMSGLGSEYFEKSLEIQLKECRQKNRGCNTTLMTIAASLSNKGKYQEAIERLEEAILVANKPQDKATYLILIATNYRKMDRTADGIDTYKRALELAIDNEKKAEILILLGDAYLSSYSFSLALNAYNEALNITKLKNKQLDAKDGISQIYLSLGMYDKAKPILVELLNEVEDSDIALKAQMIGELANIYFYEGEYDMALKLYGESLQLFDNLFEEARIVIEHGSPEGIYERWEEFKNKKARSAVSPAKLLSNIAATYTNIGNLLSFALGRQREALSNLEEALRIYIELEDIGGRIKTLNGIASLFMDIGKYEEAKGFYEEAAELSQRTKMIDSLWHALRGIGYSFWQLGQKEKAAKYYKTAIDLIDKFGVSVSEMGAEAVTAFFKSKVYIYQEFINLLLELHEEDPSKGYDKEAFIVAEKAKSRTFQELLAKAGARAEIGKNNPELKKYVDEERRLIFKLNAKRNLLTEALSKPDDKKDEDLIRKLQKEVNDTEVSLSAIEQEIENKFPKYADLKKPKPKTIEEFQKTILKNDEAIVSYFVTDKNLVTWVITPKGFRMHSVEIKGDDIREKVKAFRYSFEMIGKTKKWSYLEEFNVKIANELYNILIKPVAADLKDTKIVYISAHDALYTLPFEALIKDSEETSQLIKRYNEEKKTKTFDYDNIPFFVKDKAVSYLPSASILYSVRTFKKSGYGKWKKPLAAFANPVFCKDNLLSDETKGLLQNKGVDFTLMTYSSSGSVSDNNPCKVFNPLPDTEEEALSISSALKSKDKPYLRLDAKETTLKTMDLRPYRYLLISTHGLLAGEFRVNQPSLVLSLVGDDKNDGFLEMGEVLGLNLNADIVTLSACNTSGGEKGADRGEGFVGLTRSFMFAGTPSVLVTHWSVESLASKDLMVKTYGFIDEDGKAEALKKAKLAMIGKSHPVDSRISTSHPFFWAGFVMVGDGR